MTRAPIETEVGQTGLWGIEVNRAAKLTDGGTQGLRHPFRSCAGQH